MSKEKLQLTSVKVQPDLFEDFKMECIKTKFSLQKLTNRAIYLYLTSDDFKCQIHNQTNLTIDN